MSVLEAIAARAPVAGAPWRDHRSPALRTWALGWAGGAVLGVGNGIAREVLYQRRLGERTAHQLSTLTLGTLLAAWMWTLDWRRPIPDAGEALHIGALWAAATAAFELGLGRLVAHRPWRELLADYDVREGRVWALIPAEMLLGPLVVSRLRRWS